jgi:Zn-finger nucleic acid-binding protein
MTAICECKIALRPPKNLDRIQRLPQTPRVLPVCPKCDAALFILHFRSVEVDYCDRCRGVWLDTGELEQLAGTIIPGLTGPAATATNYLCPRCDTGMDEIHAPGNLTLERCPGGHGLWFDADELPRLLATAPATDAAVAVLNDIFGKATNPEPRRTP